MNAGVWREGGPSLSMNQTVPMGEIGPAFIRGPLRAQEGEETLCVCPNIHNSKTSSAPLPLPLLS